MAEYRVKIWRRMQHPLRPLLVKPEDIETDETWMQAVDAKEALRRVLGIEFERNDDKRFRALVQVDTEPGRPSLGDYGLMRYLGKIEDQRFDDQQNG